MKKEVVYVAVFGVLCVLAGVLVGAGIVKRGVYPRNRTGGPNFAERSERFGGKGPAALKEKKGGELFEKISAKLDLNEKQKTQAREILENARQEINKVGENMHSAINEIRHRTDKQIIDILTPQQQEKFKALLKEHEIGRDPRRQGEDRGFRLSGKDRGSHPGEEIPPQK